MGSMRRDMRQKWIHILMRAGSWDKLFFLPIHVCVVKAFDRLIMPIDLRISHNALWFVLEANMRKID